MILARAQVMAPVDEMLSLRSAMPRSFWWSVSGNGCRGCCFVLVRSSGAAEIWEWICVEVGMGELHPLSEWKELGTIFGLGRNIIHSSIHLKAVDEDSGAGMEDALCWFTSWVETDVPTWPS